jgi:hypothetical protein
MHVLANADHLRRSQERIGIDQAGSRCVGYTNAFDRILLGERERAPGAAFVGTVPDRRRWQHNQGFGASRSARIKTGMAFAPFAAAIL